MFRSLHVYVWGEAYYIGFAILRRSILHRIYNHQEKHFRFSIPMYSHFQRTCIQSFHSDLYLELSFKLAIRFALKFAFRFPLRLSFRFAFTFAIRFQICILLMSKSSCSPLRLLLLRTLPEPKPFNCSRVVQEAKTNKQISK